MWFKYEQLFIWGVSRVTRQKQLRGRLDNYIITASVCMHMCMQEIDNYIITASVCMHMSMQEIDNYIITASVSMHMCMQEISGFQGKNMQGKRRVTIFCLKQKQFCKDCDIDHLQVQYFLSTKKVNFYGPKGKLTSQKINSLFGAFFSLHSSYAAANLRNKKTNVVPVRVIDILLPFWVAAIFYIADQREPGSILVPRLPEGYPLFSFTFRGLLFGEAYIAQDFLPLLFI